MRCLVLVADSWDVLSNIGCLVLVEDPWVIQRTMWCLVIVEDPFDLPRCQEKCLSFCSEGTRK